MRGGTGLYYGDALSTTSAWAIGNTQIATIQVPNDGRRRLRRRPVQRPGADLRAGAGAVLPRQQRAPAACRFAPVGGGAARPSTRSQPKRWQNSIGFQRQFGSEMAFEADYIYSQGTDEKDVIDNVNLTYNPATGANYPFSDISRRPFPAFGRVSRCDCTGGTPTTTRCRRSSPSGSATAGRRR